MKKSHIKRIYILIPLIVLIVLLVCVFSIKAGILFSHSKNIATNRGVEAIADTQDSDALCALMAIDGDYTTRWSSENDWDNHSHFLTVKFPEEKKVSYIVINWERPNVSEYSIDASSDGLNWSTLISFDNSPVGLKQEIVLPSSVSLSYLRLNVTDVSLNEKKYFNLYQNVSVYELEVYEEAPIKYSIAAPTIEVNADGSRTLLAPDAPEGYSLTYIGANLPSVIDSNANILNNIEEKEVLVGYLLHDNSNKKEDEELSFSLSIPSCEQIGDIRSNNSKPVIIPQLQEWLGQNGNYAISQTTRIIYTSSALESIAQITSDNINKLYSDVSPETTLGKYEDAKSGDIVLSDDSSLLSHPLTVEGIEQEGYVCDISDKFLIVSNDSTGVYWGAITLVSLLKNESIPQGIIRDYPKYKVRGFGLDVARYPVSLDTLYKIIDEMSLYKLNDFELHINDNQILATSGLIGENINQAYSAFRVETDITGPNGESITSSDFYYTNDEFNKLIEYARARNINLVPEFDTPAHSLAITKVYPKYSLNIKGEDADQLDLSNKDSLSLLHDMWDDLIYDGAFSNASTINIGMDEYYGNAKDYINHLNSTITQVSQSGKNVRFWGSLSYIKGKEKVESATPDGTPLQMNLWSTTWADPTDMYNHGFDIINMQSNHLYIIPGGGYDYLDTEEIYNDWNANKFYDEYNYVELPSYSPQMLGAAYMIWNDNATDTSINITEDDIYNRFLSPLSILSDKLWKETNLIPYDNYLQIP